MTFLKCLLKRPFTSYELHCLAFHQGSQKFQKMTRSSTLRSANNRCCARPQVHGVNPADREVKAAFREAQDEEYKDKLVDTLADYRLKTGRPGATAQAITQMPFGAVAIRALSR